MSISNRNHDKKSNLIWYSLYAFPENVQLLTGLRGLVNHFINMLAFKPRKNYASDSLMPSTHIKMVVLQFQRMPQNNYYKTKWLLKSMLSKSWE